MGDLGTPASRQSVATLSWARQPNLRRWAIARKIPSNT